MIVSKNIRTFLSRKIIRETYGKAAVFLVAAFALLPLPSVAGPGSYASLDGDTLVIGNSLIERKFVWNGGNLMTYSLTDKKTGVTHYSADLRPDFSVVKGAGAGTDAEWFGIRECVV